LLILDEAWLFLKNETFADKIAEWLKVLRKKNVYVIFATQDVADVANSPLKTTIIQQCLTKIYLADPSAMTAGMFSVYREFGLTDSEISLIASAQMKRDYFYTSPIGRRLFQLDLGPLTLALIGSPDHSLLDNLALKYETGSALCAEILEAKKADYSHFLDKDSPIDPLPVLRQKPVVIEQSSSIQITEQVEETLPEENADIADSKNQKFLDAVASLPDHKRSDGSGRAAADVAKRFGVSVSTVYKVRTILKHGGDKLLETFRRGDISVKAAYKRLLKERGTRLEQAG